MFFIDIPKNLKSLGFLLFRHGIKQNFVIAVGHENLKFSTSLYDTEFKTYILSLNPLKSVLPPISKMLLYKNCLTSKNKDFISQVIFQFTSNFILNFL